MILLPRAELLAVLFEVEMANYLDNWSWLIHVDRQSIYILMDHD